MSDRLTKKLRRAATLQHMNGTPNEEDVLEVGQANFESEVLASKEPVVVMFWSPTSDTCLALEPELKRRIRKSAGAVRFATVNSDENPDLALWYGIQVIPALLYFNGSICARIEGTASKESILTTLDSWIGGRHAATFPNF